MFELQPVHRAPPNKDLKHGARRIPGALESLADSPAGGDLTAINAKKKNKKSQPSANDSTTNQVMLSLRVGVKVKGLTLNLFRLLKLYLREAWKEKEKKVKMA